MSKDLGKTASQSKGAGEVRSPEHRSTEGEASGERKGERGRAEAPGGAEGQRSTGLSRVLGMPISWLLAASEWHSRAVPQPSFLQLLEPRVISTSEKQRSRTCRTLGESRGARVLRGAGL